MNWHITPKEDDLMHYGVKGMKWRYRKGPTTKKFLKTTGKSVSSGALLAKSNAIKAKPSDYDMRNNLQVWFNANGNSGQITNLKVKSWDPRTNTVKVTYDIDRSGYMINGKRGGVIRKITKTFRINRDAKKMKDFLKDVSGRK